MCLIMTIIAAVVFTALWAKMRKQSLLTTTLMFWAAALMWSVDGIASLLEGEPFFDISREDTVLGFIIVVCGLAVFALLAAIEKRGRELKTN
ncbi:hypothetical protein II898_10705 [bacterium]|nr:hypothetical protein [bacterium]